MKVNGYSSRTYNNAGVRLAIRRDDAVEPEPES